MFIPFVFLISLPVVMLDHNLPFRSGSIFPAGLLMPIMQLVDATRSFIRKAHFQAPTISLELMAGTFASTSSLFC